MSLHGKRVLITGAARGIGWHLACEFLHAGARVIPLDIQPVDLTTLSKIGRVGYGYAESYDVASYLDVKGMAQHIGSPDILINNAGIPCNKQIAEMTIGEWRELINVNLLGPVNHIVEYLPGMIERGSGRIVNVSSGQAFFRLPTWGAYAATKAALGVLSELLDFEVRKHGVRVTTVYPFMVDTDFYKGVEGETFAGRLSMKLVPYYSDKPEKVARKIFEAVRDGKRVEMVNPLNYAGLAIRAVPAVADVVTWAAEKLLVKRKR